jgi:hypothetical protein
VKWSISGIIPARKIRRSGTKACPSATLSTTNLTWTILSTNPGLCGEKLKTVRSHYAMQRTSDKNTEQFQYFQTKQAMNLITSDDADYYHHYSKGPNIQHILQKK